MADKRKYSDRAEYLKKAVALRRKNIRLKAIEYKGGKCNICNYDKCIEALEFHHLDESKKDFQISGGTLSFKKIEPELLKCIMVCSNCHREIHSHLIKYDDSG